MSKKLQKNGLFESSRMMLPEHRETYLQHQQQIRKQSKPRLDPQETDRISRLIADSMTGGSPVELVLFRETGEERRRGRVLYFDQPGGRIKLAQPSGDDWIQMADIIGVVE